MEQCGKLLQIFSFLYPLNCYFSIADDNTLLPPESRMNLDPFGLKSDDELWTALRKAHIDRFITTLPEGLSSTVSEGGENFSAGQRQLMCLARFEYTVKSSK